MLTDPIADMLTRIRNAHLALHKEVNVPRSKMKEALAAILKQEGYVEDVAIDDRNITITLKMFLIHFTFLELYLVSNLTVEGCGNSMMAGMPAIASLFRLSQECPSVQRQCMNSHLNCLHFLKVSLMLTTLSCQMAKDLT